MASPLKIAIAGLGTVGAGVVKLLADNGQLLAQRCGRPLVVTAVSARDKSRKRGVELGQARWFDDAAALAAEADAEIVLELIGGSDGIARRVCETAIARGRSVVTANKALLALHGTALARAAEEKGVALCYEAAVAGGIPVIKALREGLAANRIVRIYGILNGTCNYILTQMRRTGRPFAEVLVEAQKLGYAEADPSFDVDGIDAAHKLAILAGLAFGAAVNFGGVHIEGIRRISPLDLEFAKELGYRLKLLGIARMTEHGIEQRVHPCLVPLETPIAAVEDVFNAVVAEGNFAGRTVFEGRGAGAGPTASAVVADLIDL
ncbi:MAG: homoserine dehydrogenase, partial [Alphaproteobacteria bacterium]|nr:homoserine dehydrogenase [Alphaproteobacteria bacterium]